MGHGVSMCHYGGPAGPSEQQKHTMSQFVTRHGVLWSQQYLQEQRFEHHPQRYKHDSKYRTHNGFLGPPRKYIPHYNTKSK